ncbi:hypothetical protein ACWD6P_35545 [Streptomyces sp. NPDC002446]
MAKWWKFGRGKGKEEGPAPEPTPAPTPPPTPAPAEGEKKRGFFGRLKDKVRPKKEKAPAAPPAEAPPAPPAAPPTAPPEAPPEEAPPEEAPPGAPPAGPPTPARVYPSFLHVEADGDWVISDTEWSGTMSGTLHGSDVKTFIDAMEPPKGGAPDYDTAIPLIADAYGIPGGLINVGASTIHSVNY